MEPVRRRLRRNDRDIVRQRRVERLGDALERRTALHVDGADLSSRVHACICPARDDELVPTREHRVERVANGAFHGPQARLPRPAVEAGPVVLEGQLEKHGAA